MDKSKEIQTQNGALVMRVSLVDSFKSIPIGQTITYDCREAGPMTSARSCVCRLNRMAGRNEFELSTTDNGVTYSVTHN